jgi:hypothetical protein
LVKRPAIHRITAGRRHGTPAPSTLLRRVEGNEAREDASIGFLDSDRKKEHQRNDLDAKERDCSKSCGSDVIGHPPMRDIKARQLAGVQEAGV